MRYKRFWRVVGHFECTARARMLSGEKQAAKVEIQKRRRDGEKKRKTLKTAYVI